MDKATILSLKEHEKFNFVEAYPGFSIRLNALIDLTSEDIPPLDEGRQAFIAELLDVSRMAAGDWLKKDRPPKPATLRLLVAALLDQANGDYHPMKVEAWLKYGDAVPNPLETESTEHQALIPLAITVILSVSKEIGVAASSYDLNEVLSATSETFADLQIRDEKMIEPVHRKIVAQFIRANIKE